MINNKASFVFLVILLLLFFNGASSASLVFRMTATDNTLIVGQEATIGIWAYAEEAAGLNGLNVWQFDMVVDTSNVIAVKTDGGTAIDLIAPSPMDETMPGWSSVNSLLSGNVLELGAVTLDSPQDSDTGVGDFSLLAEITIVAIGQGQATYDLIDNGTAGFYGILRDGGYYDINIANLEFRPGSNVFTVIPEPASLVIMAIMTGFALRSRRAGSGK